MKAKFTFFYFIWSILIFGNNKNPQNFYIDKSINDFNITSQKFKTNTSYHLFSHGKSGELYINNQWLDKEGIYQFLKNKLADKK